jgi:HK97 family phage portal protein
VELFGYTIARTAALAARPRAAFPLAPVGRGTGGWRPVVRESYAGAWQQNVEVTTEAVLTYSAVFACITLIASDIAKLGLRLMALDAEGIWNEAESPAFSPVLRKPNRYQTSIKFIEQWITSKLIHGNTYVLKTRDDRNVVTALYVLDPARVTPLVSPSGDVFYDIRRDDLSGQPQEAITLPASEIIHDTMICLWHPLIGVSPIFASGVAAMQGLSIQGTSTTFFENGANPSGMLTAPGAIADETATRLLTTLNAKKAGETLVGGDGLKYEAFTMTAVDAQLIEQLQWTGETVCSCFHVPPYMIGLGDPPPYANVEPLVQLYHAQCLQSLIVNLEGSLDEGLGLGPAFGNRYGVEVNPDDLIWLDTATRTKAAGDGISAGALSPDEARKKYYGIGSVPGGASPYMQQQYYSLAALATRDAAGPPPPPAPPPPAPPSDEADDEDDLARLALALRRRAERWYAA